MMSWSLRPYEEKDGPALKQVLSDNICGFPGSQDFLAAEKRYAEIAITSGDMTKIDTVYGGNGGGFWTLCNDEEKPVGMVGLQVKRSGKSVTAEIRRMQISEAFRGNGCGSFMLTHVLDHARSIEGLDRVSLSTVSTYEGARKFYERNGFEIDSTRTAPLHPELKEVISETEVFYIKKL